LCDEIFDVRCSERFAGHQRPSAASGSSERVTTAAPYIGLTLDLFGRRYGSTAFDVATNTAGDRCALPLAAADLSGCESAFRWPSVDASTILLAHARLQAKPEAVNVPAGTGHDWSTPCLLARLE
jgi:hypothetical protein